MLYALEQAADLVVFTRSYRLALCGGRVDGSVAVREMDPRNGFILSAGDGRKERFIACLLACLIDGWIFVPSVTHPINTCY